jgi:hypothetical protein
MLSNLNTNMKVLVGISSVAIIGIIYSLIKSFFTPNKKIEGLDEIVPVRDNGNNKVELIINKELNTKIDELNTMFQKLLQMTYDHHKLFRTNMYNTLFNNNIKYMDIHITNINSTLSNGILTMKDAPSLGFSVNGLNATSVIYKNSTFHGVQNTNYIKIVDKGGELQKFISDESTFAQIPITTTAVNSHQSDSRHHPHSPSIIYDLKFIITNDNDVKMSDSDITTDSFHIDIEIMHVDSLEIFGYLKDIYGLDVLNALSSELKDIQ